MRNPKETAGNAKSTDKMAFCHGSVCLGNSTPTNCICPTTKK
ncbi:MAG TPA: hypothetical protein VK187_00840 [Geobacteraceae bacterium]|nr:hypothetical protein [Geobacteraceae bacterium]